MLKLQFLYSSLQYLSVFIDSQGQNYKINLKESSKSKIEVMNYQNLVTSQSQEKQLSHQNRKVKIYVRINKTKKGTDIECDSSITQNKLINILEYTIIQNGLLDDESSIQGKTLQFVIQGRKLERNSSSIVQLRNLSIIHVFVTQNVNCEELKISLKYLNQQENKSITRQITVNSNQVIVDAIEQTVLMNFNKFSHEVSLVYLGHQILNKNTFQYENVQNGSQIIVIDKLKSAVQQKDQFQGAEQIQFQDIGLNFNRVKVVSKKDSIDQMGRLQMPYNPKIAQARVKKLLQENIQANQQIFLEETNLNAANIVPNLIPLNTNEHQMNLPAQASEFEKMDEQKQISTKEQIQSQKNIKKQQMKEEKPSN